MLTGSARLAVMTPQQRLVVGKERRRLRRTLVPQQSRPTARTQDAQRLGVRALRVEPVERLACDQQLDAVGCERGRLGAAVDAAEAGVSPERCLGSGTHGGIGLDRGNPRPAPKQELGEDPGARAKVGHRGAALEPAAAAQQLDGLCRVAGAIARVVLYPRREAFAGPFHQDLRLRVHVVLYWLECDTVWVRPRRAASP
jgi:hypothetical protein